MKGTQEQEPIAVIGMACRFPGGSDTPSKLWDLLKAPRDLSKRVPTDRFDSSGYYHANGSHHGATDCRDAYFLEEDVTRFDNAFFSIQPGEAEALDPQQRLLMETVYESLTTAGQAIEGLRGSQTAVYVGLMCDDWAQMTGRDWDLVPTYTATGTSRAVHSNRISYFFDWHGPSMTIDTACSSSLVAVHQGVAALRSGQSPIAIAAGANLILAPGMWIAESNLHMLSPTGTSKMWDAAADGYARGEGIAAVVLKTLSAAIRDGDNIDCIIRETGINQDGRTAGLTMPSNLAQSDLIRDTYRRAGLDINSAKDRPQFFHAHGTGTPAGDPQEAEAISRAFFESGDSKDTLYVGSIKTVIGHTEGTAGLASLIGTTLAMKHGTIPANLHFNKLSDRVAPFCTHLEVPTTALPWPATVPGQPRRASINSFGFGGTNAHAIIEGYEPEPTQQDMAKAKSFTPLTLSATTPAALRSMLSDLQGYLANNEGASMRNISHTLQGRRSTFAFRKAIASSTPADAISRIESVLASAPGEDGLNLRYSDIAKPRILGVFTGQGAQWPRMGARLIEESPFATRRLNELDQALSTLPEDDRPTWKLTDELLAEASVSRLSEAAISQPLCTAVQIVLVDLMKAADIELAAVVGHSSGEIGAAYAAGFLSATDAIRIAYYRGVYAKLARSPSDDKIKGAMMAAGISFENALELCELDDFDGRIQIAARNSSTSVTLSGDEDAINEAVDILKDEGKFARKLQVDTAYHSHHMQACAAPYHDALARCNITVQDGNNTTWFSSVVTGQTMTRDLIQAQYWVENMTGAVLFAPAVVAAVEAGPFDMAIEFGPHPALKGPCLDTIEQVSGHKIPYTGTLTRQKNDVDELSSTLGFAWAELGSGSVNFSKFEALVSGSSTQRKMLADLPTYPFDHSRSFYTLTRFSGSHRNTHTPLHPLLGRRCVETESDDEISWRNVLRSTENSWLQGHALQGQVVFPAMGYIAMAVEAAASLAGPERRLGLISLEDVLIGRAMAFGDESVGMEAKIAMKIVSFTDDILHGKITCHSGLPYDNSTPLALNFSANVNVSFHEPEKTTLPAVRVDEINLANADPQRLYSQFNKLGYNYSPPFTGVQVIQRKKGFATGEIEDISGDKWEDQLIVHPGLLDSALQTAFAAYSHPHDERFWTLHVPTAIRSVTINPYFTNRGAGRYKQFQYQSVSRDELESPVVADIDIFAGQGESHAFVQFESVKVQPFAAATARDDALIFSRFAYELAEPDARVAVEGGVSQHPDTDEIFQIIERVGFYYLRRLHETITPEEASATLTHYQLLLDFASRTVPRVARGDHPTVPKEAMADSSGYIRSLIAKYRHRSDLQLLETVGENIIPEIRRNGSMIEHMLKDGVLDQFYEEGFEFANIWIGRIVAQIAHRHPRMRVFEIGAGTGGSTRTILPMLGDAFASYTFTDLSAGFFERANDRFINYSDRMIYSTYNMEISPSEQGFEEGSYDLVLASNVLHATGKIEDTMANARRLLRPGGYLVLIEIMGNDYLGIGATMGGLPGWWAGAAVDPARRDGPCLTLDQWDTLVRRHGFNGVETHTPLDRKLQWYAVLVCRAVDDRVLSLRDPLQAPVPVSNTSDLVIVGGRTLAIAELIKQASALLKFRYPTVTHMESLEELNPNTLAPGSTVLSLVELDQQFLETRTEAKLEALKTLWRNGRSIMWVTRGARHESPHSASMVGLARVARYEYPHINLQIVDFDLLPTANAVAESLLRLELGKRFEDEGAQLLWTVEPELHYVNDQLHIPRLYPYIEANQRYNTCRRTVSAEVNPQKATVVLEPTANGTALKACAVSPLRISLEPRGSGKKQITIRLQQSVLQSIKIHNVGFFNLCAGTELDSGEDVLAFIDAPVESSIHVPVEWSIKVPEANDMASAMVQVAAYILAQSIIAAAPRFGTLVVHEGDPVLTKAIDMEAAREGVQVAFTTASKAVKNDHAVLFIHNKLPTRLVRKLLPRDVSLFVNLAPASPVTELLASCLPRHTATATATDFFRVEPSGCSNSDVGQASQVLKSAWSAVTKLNRRGGTTPGSPSNIVSLADINSQKPIQGPLSIVDWNTEAVEISLRPIDHGNIFRANGTYFLVGLSGELGQSLCSWMVAHGARHVVLSSRRPKVDPRYIEEMASQGATVRAMAADVTRRDSLRACYDIIRAEMPPIIGVANGAMILEDVMFDDLQFESQERTMPPKVEGSMYLDELFYDTPLDFFILFTSLAHIGGNTGQSTYVMANLFMVALAAQRRDVRGVVGSDMAIGSVTGMGFFERSSLDPDHFSRMGYRNMSEQDFHQQFAEAILAGRPGTKGISEVAVGLQPYHDTPNIQAQLRTDPRFRHYLLQDRDSSTQGLAGGSNGGAKPRVLLAKVKSRAEAFTVVYDAFIERLKRILLMSSTETIDPMVSLVELGADSIMAVDVRAWFLKELDVDIPVLKILGPGENLSVLVEEAVDKLPVDIVDVSKLAEGEAAVMQQAMTAKPKIEQPIVLETTSAASSSITETDSSPASATPVETPMGVDTETEFFGEKSQQLAKKLQEKQEETGQSWRQAVLQTSTEHTEQMTYGQNRFWFLTHYVDDPTTFNIAYLGKLTGRIRVNDLAKAVESAAQRHESLRTRFFWSNDDTKTPMQGILSKTLVRLETATIESLAQAAQELDDMRNYVWDLGDWVPLRMRLLSLSESEHFLIIGSHHISMDGHSFSVLMMDIQLAYNNPGQRLTALPDASQARSFGQQQRIAFQTGKLRSAVEHHRKTLPSADLARPIELFSFARTQVRPPLDRYETHVAKIQLPLEITAKLKQLARGHRATAFHAYLAALQALLFQLLPAATTDRVIIGLADANRLDSKFMGSIGNFLNVLPVRFDRTSKQTFGEAMALARDRAYTGLKHSALPFDLLLDELEVPRSNAWAPVFQVFMDYRLVVKDHANKNWIGCKIGDENWHTSRSGYDVALEIMEGQDGAMVAIHVQKALYNSLGAELLVNSYVNVLKQVATKGDRVPVQELQKWDTGTVRKGLIVGNGPSMSLKWPATVAHRIDQVIAANSDSIALKDGYGKIMTYREMDQRVNSICHTLRGLPTSSGKQPIVGVFQMPSANWMCSLLAIHRIGAVYLPLDLRNGAPRLKSTVHAARPAALLADADTMERVKEICDDEEIMTINVSDSSLHHNPTKVETVATATDSAYIIFTSGSTGEPKGIVVKHAGLRANLEGYHVEWAIDTVANVVLQQTALSFDASLVQIFAALTTGGCLFVVPADARGDPAEVTRLMVEHGVTMTQATPSEYDMWFRFAPETLHRCKTWKAAWFGGERAGPSVLDGFRKSCKAIPSLRVFTSYGPTESTISAMKGEADVRNPDLRVPVPGRLLPNYAAYIVDEAMQLVPTGVPGEIVLGGAGVGNNEYLNRPELTAKQFQRDRFASRQEDGWGRMFRTGDYGRLDARGYLTVEGRIAGDTQVKLRGFRIELAEIERVMVKESGGSISDAVVTLRGEGEQDGFLVAHVVFEGHGGGRKETAETVDQLRARLPLCLPQYMCPAVIVPLDRLPLTSHHKVDRGALQALPLPMAGSEAAERSQSLTATEMKLAKLWDVILPPRTSISALDPRSDFFRSGGNSLLLVKLQAAIKSEFSNAPRLSKLMNAPELGTMAALIDDGAPKVNWDKEIELGESDKLRWQARISRATDGLCVLVTGATGSLGRSITRRLAKENSVSRVVCLVRPAEGRDMSNVFPGIDKKVQIISADLPFLPADVELYDVDVVLHCAADRNFWDGYHAVKPVNVDSTKALARLCLRIGARLHVLSSGSVSEYETEMNNFDITHTTLPRPNPDEGYLSSKWAAERYLSRVARETGLQIIAHRPTRTLEDAIQVEEMANTENQMAHQMFSLSQELGVRPEFTNLGGTIDIAPLADVVATVTTAITTETPTQTGMHIMNHYGNSRMRTDALATVVKELFEKDGNENLQKLPVVSALHWVGLAKQAGLFEWFFTSQNLVVEDDKGNMILSRR